MQFTVIIRKKQLRLSSDLRLRALPNDPMAIKVSVTQSEYSIFFPRIGICNIFQMKPKFRMEFTRSTCKKGLVRYLTSLSGLPLTIQWPNLNAFFLPGLVLSVLSTYDSLSHLQHLSSQILGGP